MIGLTSLAVLAALVAFANLYGRLPERMMAWLLLGFDLLDHVNHQLVGPTDFVRVDPGHLVLSALSLATMLWIALRANRFWPLPVCSLQLINLTGHLAVLAEVPGFNVVYWAMTALPVFLQMAIVTCGILAHARREARIGAYRDWRKGLSAFSGQLAHKQTGILV
jgi:hypothetical protein